MKPLPPPWATARKSPSVWRSNPGSIAWRCALLDDLSRPDESNGHAVPLEDSARRANVKASDEAELQFHQPDESITGATVIRRLARRHARADPRLRRAFASDRFRAARSWFRAARGLHSVCDRRLQHRRDHGDYRAARRERVWASFLRARDHLRKAPGLARQFQGRFAPTGAA